MTHTAIWEKVIDGALCRLKGDELQFQPRAEDGDTLWGFWYRDKFYDGWAYETRWLSVDQAASTRRTEPVFAPDPIRWTLEQITQAKVWAGDVLATRKIAANNCELFFSAPRAAAE